MNIIIGHTNMDLDSIGSLVLARYMYRDHVPVRSHLIQPVARHLYNLYEHHLKFASARDLQEAQVEQIVVVDTRTRSRIREYLEYLPDFSGALVVYDHHPGNSSDLENAVIHDGDCGANTSLLGLELIKRDIRVSPEDATLALIGIYADTGRFTYTSVRSVDFEVAAYLLDRGASLEVLERFLRSMRDERQLNQFHRMLNSLVHRDIKGHAVLFCYLQLEKQVQGLAAVAEKVFEVENADALFAIFGFEKQNRSLIVARSRKQNIDMNRLLEPFGGGGHPQAASAVLRDQCGEYVLGTLEAYLDEVLAPAVTADGIMCREVQVIDKDWRLVEASMFLERVNHTSAPVVDREGRPVGYMTLRDIMKGRKANQMHAPVRAYMARKLIACRRDTTVREIERLMFKHNIGHVPVTGSDGLEGIVSRTDLLRFFEAHVEVQRAALEKARRQP